MSTLEQLKEKADELHRNRVVNPSREEIHNLITETYTTAKREALREVKKYAEEIAEELDLPLEGKAIHLNILLTHLETELNKHE